VPRGQGTTNPESKTRDSISRHRAARQARRGNPATASDWRAFRAALVAQEAELGADAGQRPAPLGAPGGWAHPIARPERGCLLLARHADMGPAFDHSVVFMLDHGAPSLNPSVSPAVAASRHRPAKAQRGHAAPPAAKPD